MQALQALIAKVMGAFLVLVLAFGLGYLYRDSKATKEALEDKLTAFSQLDKSRQVMQGRLDEIGKDYVEKQAAAEDDASRTIASLHDDGYRLRIKLADATIASITSNGRCQFDGRAEISDDSAKFLIGQAKRADDQVKGLQEVVRELQGGDHEQGRSEPPKDER